MANSVDLDQTVLGPRCLLLYLIVSNVRQLFAADDFSRRHFQMHFFLGALRVKATSFLFFPCADPESFFRGGPTLTVYFTNNNISVPPSAHQLNTIKWRFAGVLMMAQL